MRAPKEAFCGNSSRAFSNVDWLLREATDERTLRLSERTVIDDARWRATLELIELGAGLRVYLTDAEARSAVTVKPHVDRTDQWVSGQVTLAGRADIDFLDGTRTDATPQHALLFRSGSQGAAYSLASGARFHSVGYGLSVKRILGLFDGDVPGALAPLLEADIRASRVVAMRGERAMRHLAESLFARGLNGPLRRLMMEGAAVQLLAVQAAAAERRSPSRSPRALSPPEHEAIRHARTLLLANMRHPPTLRELAAAVGLSEKGLNTSFRAVFGTTVFQTLRNERLEHARIVLASEAASLKEIAFRVGYNHVSNFINAFTARYGAPPRRYRDRAN